MFILFIACGEKDINEAPSSPQISFPSDPVLAGESLEVQFDEASFDPNGDKVTYESIWYLNDEVQSDLSNEITIPEGIILGGQKWQVEVVASDGSLQSEPAVAEIEISNTLPTAFITESVVTTDMDANWKISVEDVDQQELNLEIEIKVNDTTIQTDSNSASFPYEEFDISLSSENFKKGDEVVVLIKVDDSFGIVEETGSLIVGNTGPEILELSLSEGSVMQPPLASISAEDIDGDSVIFQTQWLKSGSPVGDVVEIEGVLESEDSNIFEADIEFPNEFQKNEIWSLSVTPFDGESSGFAVTSNEITIQNSPPSILEGEILPENIYADSLVSCSVLNAEDPDEDEIMFQYIWTSNGVEIAQGQDLSIADVQLYQGADLRCEILPSDDEASGQAYEITTVVLNTAPVVEDVVLDIMGGANGTVEDTVECNFDIFDVDQDSTSSTISWYQNGNVLTGETTSTLSLGTMSKNDEIYCSVSATDSIESSVEVVSNSISIANSIPSITSIQLSPTTVTSADVVLCSYDGYSDADVSDMDQSIIEWLDSTNNVLATTLAFDVQNQAVSQGDLLKCRVTPYDGEDFGSPLIKPFIIQNAPPVVSVELSTDTIYTESELSVSIDASDVENDLFSLQIEWLVDGTLVKETLDYNDGTTQIEDYTDSLDGNFYFVKGQEVVVRTTVTQLEDNSIFKQIQSESLIVQNTNPPAPNVRFEPMNPFPGESVTCVFDEGEPVDVDGDELTYEVHWYQNDQLFQGVGTITSSIVEEGEPIVTNDILLDGVITLAAEWRCTMTVTDIDGGTNEGSYSFDICPLGQYEECAASSCGEIKDAGYDLQYINTTEYNSVLDPDPFDSRPINGPFDGLYWLELNGSDPAQYYCDMNTDDGGWTHLLTAGRDSEDFLTGGAGWTSVGSDSAEEQLRTFDQNAGDQAIQFPTYGLLETNEIRLCYGFSFPANIGDAFPHQQCFIFPHGQERTLQSFFVDGATHIDCSKGNELYGIEDINLDGEGNNAFCLDYSAYRGAMSSYSTLQEYTGCYWLGINQLGTDELGNENGTGSALGLLYSSGGDCEYDPTIVGSTWGIGLGLIMEPQFNTPSSNRLWHVFGR